ncbi:MAG TPA: GldG family protein [bacterium]|jgi:gliding-associated putative ABC transporter substrate-binding component GldG|nr:GldG family protein [bacterium]HQO92055.1 GldG family protein [bacterium]HRQ68917.1 GldG family protein [bacterium]
MKNKRRDAVISVVLATAIAIFINILATDLFYRLDFTKGGLYTISSSTKEILSKLNDDVEIKFYVSEELPPKVLPIKRNVLDLLTEYERYGGGKVTLSILYPEKSADIEKDARSAGIQKVQLNVIGQNKEELQAAYMGIVLFFKDKMETLPVVLSVNDLEFQLTSLILKLAKDKKERITFLNSKPQLPPDLDPQMRAQLAAQMPQSYSINQDTQAVAQALRELYHVEEIRLEKGESFKEDTKIVVLHEPANLSGWEKFAVDQFLMKGGKVIVLQSGMKVSQQGFAQEKQSNYDDMFKSYGFDIQKNMVMDVYNYSVMIPQGNMRYLAPYPLWIKIPPENISSDLPESIRNAGTLAFTYTSSINLNKVEDIDYKSIVKSSGKSWAQSSMVMLDPSAIKEPSMSDLKVFDLAVLGQGKFKSAFTKETLPEEAKDRASDLIEKGIADGAVFYIAAPEFILDRTVQNFQSNGIFFINMVDYLTNSTDLVNIRSRGQGFVHISPEITDNAKNIIKWTGTLLVPFIVIVFGLIRMISRNRRSGRA